MLLVDQVLLHEIPITIRDLLEDLAQWLMLVDALDKQLAVSMQGTCGFLRFDRHDEAIRPAEDTTF